MLRSILLGFGDEGWTLNCHGWGPGDLSVWASSQNAGRNSDSSPAL